MSPPAGTDSTGCGPAHADSLDNDKPPVPAESILPVKLVLIGAVVSLVVGLFGTRSYIALASTKGWGQFVRDDGPTSHHVKRGTPQMGGLVIISATVLGYGMAHLLTWSAASVSGLLLLFLMAGIGFVGFLDDWTKRSDRNGRSASVRERS